MTGSNFRQQALYEHRFWLRILRDHASFIHSSLPPTQTELAQQTMNYMRRAEHLLARLNTMHLSELNREAYHLARGLRRFKLGLLRNKLQCGLQLGLTPTFINHMVNEVSEYLRVIQALIHGKAPVYHPVRYHLLWLQDAYGHAAAIKSSLDLTESKLMQQADRFDKTFRHFYLKAAEFAGYLRSNLMRFPALARFNRQADLEMMMFRRFLQHLRMLGLNHAVLGTLTPLLADHMLREECYYLTKLAASTGRTTPPCRAF